MRALTPAATQNLRRALLATVALVSAVVVFSLRRPAPVTAPDTPVAPPSASGASFSEIVYRSFRAGRENFVVKARRNVGDVEGVARLLGVEVSLPGVRDGRPTTTTIAADEALYDPQGEKATFRGNVKVTTDDGLQLATETLMCDLKGRRAETKEPVRFERGRLSGSATGMAYDAAGAHVELRSEVFVSLASESGPPTEVRSARAALARDERTVRFEGSVESKRGAESLQAGRLTLRLNENLQTVDRAVAVDDVDLRTAGAGSSLPGGGDVAGSRGPRRLRCRNLEMWFRDDGSLLGATARPDAELEVLAGPGEPPERRVLKARRLDFGFDTEGRLERLQGRTDVSYRSEPIAPAPGTPRSVRCQGLEAAVDPASGSVQTITFSEAVEFSQGRRKAAAGKAVYDEARATLFLTDRPRVLDEEEGSDLRAQEIDLGTKSGDVAARGSVRHELARKGGKSRGGLLAGDEPVLLLARSLEYLAASRTGRYREEAVVRSAKDEVSAPLIVLEETAAGSRRLTASGGVVSLMHPQPKPTDKKAPAPVEVRAKDMVYEEEAGRLVYEGEVVLRQGDIVSKSPKATVTLSADGSRAQTIVAGEPVEVRQGERTAKGSRGTYTPENETLVLVGRAGEKITLNEPGKKVEGSSLTFHVGANRALVQGQEERTESVFRRERPRP